MTDYATLKALSEAAKTAYAKHRYNTVDFSRLDAEAMCEFEKNVDPDVVLSMIAALEHKDALLREWMASDSTGPELYVKTLKELVP